MNPMPSISGNKLLTIIIAALMLTILITFNRPGGPFRKQDQEFQQALDSLRFIKRKLVTFDSIQTASQKRFLDSLSSIKKELENEKVQRLKADAIMRKRNQDLENRFNSIPLPTRPDF